MQKEKKIVEWIDTNNKPYYVSCSFPIMLTNRFWFFWANTSKGWRKVLNLANGLAQRNKISVVFLYGTANATVKNYINKFDNAQLVVLYADYIKEEDVQVIDRVEEWLKQRQVSGDRKKDENNNWAFDVSEYFIKYRLDFESDKKQYDEFLSAKQAIEDIKCAAASNGFKVIGKIKRKAVSGKQDEMANDLLDIAKELFPCGIEVDTKNEFAYKRVAVPKMINLGLNGDTDDALVKNCGVKLRKEKGIMQFSFFDDYSPSATSVVDLIRTTYNRDLAQLGYTNVTTLTQVLVNRPYGLYECNYYYYVIAYALTPFLKELFFTPYTNRGDLMPSSIPVEEGVFSKRNIFLPFLYRQSDKQKSLIRKICKLFDITKEVKTLQGATLWAIQWITDNIHFDSIDRISHELFSFIKGETPFYSLETEKMDDWLDDKKMTDIYKRLRTVDTDFFKMVAEQYGDKKARLYKRHGYVKGCAGGWLWESNLIDEHLEEYMSKILCRECGRVLNPFGDKHCYEVSKYENEQYETHDFTLKEISGLNKKFFGRYQKEYYCIPCMAAILETSEWELWQKVHEFKESGCTLF